MTTDAKPLPLSDGITERKVLCAALRSLKQFHADSDVRDVARVALATIEADRATIAQLREERDSDFQRGKEEAEEEAGEEVDEQMMSRARSRALNAIHNAQAAEQATIAQQAARIAELEAENKALSAPLSAEDIARLDLIYLVDGWPHPSEVRRIIALLDCTTRERNANRVYAARCEAENKALREALTGALSWRETYHHVRGAITPAWVRLAELALSASPTPPAQPPQPSADRLVEDRLVEDKS